MNAALAPSLRQLAARRMAAFCGVVASLALVIALATPVNAQDATQRLLEAKRRQEQGLGPATAPMGQASQPGQPGQPAAGGEDEAVPIEAKGVASWYANDPARSREEAIEAAQRDAVEQASGVMLQSETQMRNLDLVSDEVLSKSKGFIRSYEVLKEGQDGPFYNVNIRAQVVRKAFISTFENALEDLYRRVGKPRIMLVVQEVESSAAAAPAAAQGAEAAAAPQVKPDMALNVVEKEIRKILLKQGFTFIDARALPKTAQGGSNDQVTDALLRAARTSNAELVMLGRGRIGERSMLQKFNVVQASVGLDVLRSDNGQVMASDVVTGKGLHINADTAAVTALQKAAEEITPRIMEQVTYQWLKEKNEGQRIEMVVKGATFGDMLNLRRSLGNTVKGVKKVRQKSFTNGTALLELESKDSADRLAESLFEAEFDGFKLNIENVTATTLTVKLVKVQ